MDTKFRDSARKLLGPKFGNSGTGTKYKGWLFSQLPAYSDKYKNFHLGEFHIQSGTLNGSMAEILP